MTIDFLSGEITSEQYTASPELIAKGSNTLKPGAVGFIPIEAIWADEDDRLWLDETINCDFDPAAMCEHADIARVIRVEEGYIIDMSHVVFEDDDPPFYRVAESEKESAYKDSAPIIGLVRFPVEREMLAGILKNRYGDNADALDAVETSSGDD